MLGDRVGRKDIALATATTDMDTETTAATTTADTAHGTRQLQQLQRKQPCSSLSPPSPTPRTTKQRHACRFYFCFLGLIIIAGK